jgi:hypothetical protein
MCSLTPKEIQVAWSLDADEQVEDANSPLRSEREKEVRVSYTDHQ